MTTSRPGALMQTECSEAAKVLLQRLRAVHDLPHLIHPRAIYTIARGSSDAVATVLNYDVMRCLEVPATTLPPSSFSIENGVDLSGATVLTISQSGASADLVEATKGARKRGAVTVAITNVAHSDVEKAAGARIEINAGEERAVPATKSVIGSIAAGAALLGSLVPDYASSMTRFAMSHSEESLRTMAPMPPDLSDRVAKARHVFIVGRGGMFGAAQEMALKLKECCGIHAEAFSASEVLHGPMQIAESGLLTLILDDGAERFLEGLDLAETRLASAGSDVVRLLAKVPPSTPSAISAAVMLINWYPVVLDAALALKRNPDFPSSLAKVTSTR